MSPSVKASSRRWLWLAPLLLLAVPLWLVTLLALFLETGLGKRTAAGLLEAALSQPGQQVSIEGVEGSFFGRLRVQRIAFSDAEGAWMELDEVALDWVPRALFDGTLSIERLAAKRLALQRLPPATPEQPPSEGPQLPQLPFEVAAKEIAIERIELGEPLLGEAATLTLDASLAIESERALLDAAVTRLDAAGGFLAANLVWDPASNALQLKLQAQEPAGGVAARLAGLPGLPAVDLDLDGTGTFSAWKGRLRLALGGEVALTADLELAGDAPQSVTVTGRMTSEGALLVERLSGLDALSAWAPDGLDIVASATRDADKVAVTQLSLTSRVFTFEGSGSLDGEAMQGTGQLSLADGRPLAALVPDLALASGDFELRIEGTLRQPSATLTFDAQQVAYDLVAFERARGTLDAKSLGGDAFDLALTLHAVDPQLEDPAPTWTWGDTDLTAAGTLAADDVFELRHLDLQARDLKLAWNGPLALGGEEPFSLDTALSGDALRSLSLEGRVPREIALLIERLSGVEGLAAWAPEGLDVVASATREGDKVTVSQLSLASSVFTFKGSGSLDGEAVQGTGQLSLADGRPLAALVPDLDIASGDFELTADGTLQQPRATLTFDAQQLAYDLVGFEHAHGTINAQPSDDGAIDLALTLRAVDPQLEDPALAWTWGDTDLTAAGTLAADGSFELRQLDLQARDLKLAWNGPLALGGEEPFSVDTALSGEALRSLSLEGRVPREIAVLIERLSGVEGLAAWAPEGLDVVASATREGDKLTVSQLSLASTVITFKGSGSLDGEALQGTGKLSLADGRPLASLFPDLAVGRGDFDLTVDGTLQQPSATLMFDAERVAYDPVAFERARGTLRARPRDDDAIDLALTLHAVGPRLDDPAPAWIWGDSDLTAAGTIAADGTFELRQLALQARDLTLAWDGSFAVDTLAAEGHLILDGRLPELAQMPGAVLDLEVDAELQSDDLAEAGSATLAGHLKGSGTLPPEAAELLRAGVDFAGGVELAEDGTLTLSAASMQGQGLAVDLDGTLKGEAVDFSFRLEAQDLAAIATPLGVEAAGSLHLEGELEGDKEQGYGATADLNATGLVYAGQQIGALAGRLDLSGFPQEPEGMLTLNAPATPYGPLAVAATVKPQADGGFLLEPLKLQLGSTLQLAGRLQAPEAMLPLSGRLSGELAGSALLTELTGLDLKGKGAIDLDLSGSGGQQAATVSLRLQPGELEGVAHRGLTLRGQAQDLLGTPHLDTEFTASGVALGSTTLASVSGTARGPLRALDVTLAAAGTSDGQPLKLDLAAQLDAMAAAPAIRLQRLQGTAMAQHFRLLKPTTLHLGDTLRLESTALEIAGTTLTLELSDRAGERQLRASFDALRAKTLAAFLPDYDASGTLSGTLTLTDRGSGATGTLELRGSDLLVQQQGLAVAPSVDVAGTAKLGGGSLSTALQLSGGFGENLAVDLSFPFRVSLYDFDVVVPGDGKLAGRASWRGEVAQLVDFLPLDNQVLAGNLTLDLRLTGTLGSPRVAGELALANGRYENLVYGTLVESLNLRMTGEGRQLVVQEASASDGRGGTLTMTGSIDVAEMAMDLTLQLKDFAVVQRDDLFAAFDAKLKIERRGDLQVLAGTLTGREARLDVAARLPQNVTTLDVVVLQDGEPLGPARERAGDWRQEEAPLPFVLGLDVVVDLPHRIFVHGSGLESEWGGRLEITGTTAQPIIRGQLTPKRGQFDALGRAFVLQNSAITFDGGPTVDPILSIEASADSGGFTAIVQVSGRASDPEIHFTSNPVLPEQEVISRMLFGRGTGKLSALEAVQLAEALAIFSGAAKSKVGLVDRLRVGLGLDVLRFDAGSENEQIGQVTAGEYISKDVFVGVSQGTTAGSTSATVEYDVTDDIVIEGRAGQQSSVGIRWQWDY